MEQSNEEQAVPAGDPAEDVQRSLGAVLLSDANTVVTGVTTAVISSVAGAYAVKKVLGGKDNSQGGDPSA